MAPGEAATVEVWVLSRVRDDEHRILGVFSSPEAGRAHAERQDDARRAIERPAYEGAGVWRDAYGVLTLNAAEWAYQIERFRLDAGLPGGVPGWPAGEGG